MIAACSLCRELIDGGAPPAAVGVSDAVRAELELAEYRMLCHASMIHFLAQHREVLERVVNPVMVTAGWCVVGQLLVSTDERYTTSHRDQIAEVVGRVSMRPAEVDGSALLVPTAPAAPPPV